MQGTVRGLGWNLKILSGKLERATHSGTAMCDLRKMLGIEVVSVRSILQQIKVAPLC